MEEGFLDVLYEAALLADRWPAILERISASCGAKGGVLHVHTEHERRWTASPEMRAIFEAYLAAGWPDRSDRVSRGIKLNRAGFVTDTDLFSEAEMAKQPVYRDFLIPRGLQSMAATHVGYAADGDLVLSLWGFASHAAANSSVPALNGLRPDLARASMIAAQQQLRLARTMVEALAGINVPSAVLGQRRRVLASNDLFNSRLSSFGHDTPGGLRLSDASADAALGDLLAKLEGAIAVGDSMPLRLVADRRAVLHVLPVRGAARDFIMGACALLTLTAPDLRHSQSAAIIQSLFELTPAESRLTLALCETKTLKKAARRLGITEGTARTALKRVFSKTRVHSQSELLVLLTQYNASVDLGSMPTNNPP